MGYFTHYLAHLIGALALLLQACSTEPVRPNIVILLSDDLGYQDIGCYSGPVKTRALDSLAANGVKFETFYSGCAVCSPSRAMLLTGRHHIRTGIYNWIDDRTQKSHLLEREITIAEILKDAGYSTAHFGKWHLGLPNKKYAKPTPSDHGFDYWFATANNAYPNHHNPVNFIRNGEPVGPMEGYSCQIVVDEAIEWLDNHRRKETPFFLNVWFHEPHMKVAAPEDLVACYQGPEQIEGLDSKQREIAPVYSGTIENTDRAIARLLKKLSEVSPSGNTLIVYSSDNGSYLKNRNGSFRGHKGLNWEGGLRVPGIFYWPGKISAGKTVSTPAGLVDILPTLCALLALDTPADRHLDGSDITALLTGNESDFIRHQPFYWHLQRSSPIVAIRDGKYSLVAFRDNDELPLTNNLKEQWIPMIKHGGYKDYQLFDLSKDPNQTTDIASQFPVELEMLKSKLLEINTSVMAEGHDWHLKDQVAVKR